MRPGGWGLIQYDCCPSKKKGLGHRHTHPDGKTCEDRERRQPSTSLRRRQPCRHLGLGLLSLGRCRNKFLLFQPPDLWYFVMAAPARLIHLVYYFLCHSGSLPFKAGEGGRRWVFVKHPWPDCIRQLPLSDLVLFTKWGPCRINSQIIPIL